MRTSPTTNRFEALRASQQFAYDRAPSIRAVYELATMTPQDLQGPADLARLAVTSKDALLEKQRQSPPFGGFLAADDASIRRVFVSPGPVYEPQLFDDDTGHGFRMHSVRQASARVTAFSTHGPTILCQPAFCWMRALPLPEQRSSPADPAAPNNRRSSSWNWASPAFAPPHPSS